MCSGCFALCAVPCAPCGGGTCSEFVGPAACNPTFCGSCLTGAVMPPVECVTAGGATSGAPCIMGNPCITPCLIPNSQIPCSAVQQLGPCNPCSPLHCGATDTPPCAGPYTNPDVTGYGTCQCTQQALRGGGSGPKGGGSGGGSALGSSGGGAGIPRSGGTPQGTQNLLNKFGSMLASLFGGGKNVAPGTVLPGQKPKSGIAAPITANTFLIVIVIVGALLMMMNFGGDE